MTDESQTARRVGRIRADGDGADVYEENGVFYAVGSTLVITADDEEVVQPTRSAAFASPEAFLETLPLGVAFVPAGEDGAEDEE